MHFGLLHLDTTTYYSIQVPLSSVDSDIDAWGIKEIITISMSIYT